VAAGRHLAVPPAPPEKIVEKGAPSFLCLSLRTQVLPEAMKRAAALLAAMERIEQQVMAQSAVVEMDSQTVRLIVNEVVRQALVELVRAETSAAPQSPAEADAASARLADDIQALRQFLRLRDGAPARPAMERAMAALGLAPQEAVPGSVEREALGGLLDVHNVAAALDEGHSLEQATRDVRSRYLGGRDVEDLRPTVMLSAAIAEAERLAVSVDMARKIAATGKLMLAWEGDMPLDLFVEKKTLIAFLMWLRRLPKGHGRRMAGTASPRSASSSTSTRRSRTQISGIGSCEKRSRRAAISTCGKSALISPGCSSRGSRIRRWKSTTPG
jgi:hypothetical protein